MSTIPTRVKNINDVLQNINDQSVKPSKIFLNIPYKYKRFNNHNITDSELENINKDNLEITRCDDYGPGTKVMGSLAKIRKYDYVILLDDDHIYDLNICKIFLESYKKEQVNYSFYLNKIFNIKMGQCADGFLINTELLSEVEHFFNSYVKNNLNMFMDDDLWLAIYLQREKKSVIKNLILDYKKVTNKDVIYEKNINSAIDGLHLTVHKDRFFINRRKIQKIEYIKYTLKKFLKSIKVF